MYTVRYVFLLLFIACGLYAGDRITIHNKTEKMIFVRIYYLSDQGASAYGKRYTVESGASLQMERPLKENGRMRHIAFSLKEVILADAMKKKRFERLPSIGIGVSSEGVSFDNFFIQLDQQGKLKGCNTAAWNAQSHAPKS